MNLKDEIVIAAPRDEVFAALNDPDILRQSIPGCESLEQTGDDQFAAVAKVKIGPVSARFKGDVTLSDIVAPESYRISGQGKGGPAGFAKGGATVTLTEEDGGLATRLSYDVKADVGGKLAQVGNRLIEGSSKALAAEFFSNFEKLVTGNGAEVESAADATDAAGATPMTPGVASNPVVWALAGAALLAILYWMFV